MPGILLAFLFVAAHKPGQLTANNGGQKMRLLLTITETCEALNIGRSSLYRLIGEGKIPARKVGRKTLLLRADIEEFAASLTTA